MIEVPCIQGSAEWFRLRLGIPTTSGYDRILTPKKAEPAAAQGKYVYTLVAEWLLGHPLDEEGTDLTLRGQDLEDDACRFYEFDRDVELVPSGFCLSDDRMTGCSVDRFVGTDGIVEIKCPGASHHVAYLLGEAQDEHRPQIQGQLWITGRQWVDLLAYHPELPSVVVRYGRDDLFIKKLATEMPRFLARLMEAKEKMIRAGHHPPDDGVAGWLKTWLERSLAEVTP